MKLSSSVTFDHTDDKKKKFEPLQSATIRFTAVVIRTTQIHHLAAEQATFEGGERH